MHVLTGQTSMADPNGVMSLPYVKQLQVAHSIPGHSWFQHLTWMDTAMHDVGSHGHTQQIGLPRDWANLALNWHVWRGVVRRC